MRTIFQTLLGLALCAALVVGWVYWRTAPLVAATEQFFDAVKAQDYPQAWQYLSADFQQTTSEQVLQSFLSGSQLEQYESADWTQRSLQGPLGELVGVVSTQGGKHALRLRVVLVQEQEQWRIQAIERPRSGFFLEGAAEFVPGPQQLDALLQHTMQAFAKAVEQDQLTALEQMGSSSFRQQSTVDYWAEQLEPLRGLRWGLLTKVRPQLHELPIRQGNGMLLVRGRYPLQTPVQFRYCYAYEGIAWRLQGIRVALAAAALPDISC